MDVKLSKEEITTLINSVKDLISKAQSQAQSVSWVQQITDSIYANTELLQGMLNNLLSKQGVITQNELDALDEQIRATKENVLKTESYQSSKNFAIMVASGIALIGLVWYINKA